MFPLRARDLLGDHTMPQKRRVCEPSCNRAMNHFLELWTPVPIWGASDAALRLAIFLSADAAMSPSTRPHPTTWGVGVEVPAGHAMVTIAELVRYLGYSRRAARESMRELVEIGFIEATDQRFVYRVRARPAPPLGRF